jgi:hypothetical protein
MGGGGVNDPLVEHRLLQKYDGISIFDKDFDIFFDLLSSSVQFQCQRKSCGWVVLSTPPEYIGDGSDDCRGIQVDPL